MQANSEQYNLAAIRSLMRDAFTDIELRRFCQERSCFRPVLSRISSKASLDDEIDATLEYCLTRDLVPELLSDIEEYNPRKYEHFKAQLRDSHMADVSTPRTEAPGLAASKTSHTGVRTHEKDRRGLGQGLPLLGWFVVGAIIVGCITFAFWQPIRCILEYRESSRVYLAVVSILITAISAFLAILLPRRIQKMILCFCGGAATCFLVFVVASWLLAPISQDRCPGTLSRSSLPETPSALTRVGGSYRIYTNPVVLVKYPGDPWLSRILVHGRDIFVLDRNSGKVYHHLFDDLSRAVQPESMETVAVSSQEQIGNIVVGELVDMTWVSSSDTRQKEGLVILENNHRLIEYNPDTRERTVLNVADSEMWDDPKLLSSYFGILYILDTGAGTIWRYEPTPDGYSNHPEDWLEEEVDLTNVADMVATGDESFHLLDGTDTILKLTNGVQDTFDISAWMVRPFVATAIFGSRPEETRWLYIADSGNSRFVQCDKNGPFRQAFALKYSDSTEDSDILAVATGLFVDEIASQAYFVTQNKLHMMILSLDPTLAEISTLPPIRPTSAVETPVPFVMQDTETPDFAFSLALARPSIEWTGFFGRVFDSQQKPLAGVPVIVWYLDGSPASSVAYTDLDGVYRIGLAEGPLAGDWTIQVLTEDFEPGSKLFTFQTDANTASGIQQIQVFWQRMPK